MAASCCGRVPSVLCLEKVRGRRCRELASLDSQHNQSLSSPRRRGGRCQVLTGARAALVTPRQHCDLPNTLVCLQSPCKRRPIARRWSATSDQGRCVEDQGLYLTCYYTDRSDGHSQLSAEASACAGSELVAAAKGYTVLAEPMRTLRSDDRL